MNLRPRLTRPRLGPILPSAVLLSLLALGATVATADVFRPQPSSDVTIVPVGGKPYVQLGADPVIVPLVGPGRFYGYVRAGFAPDESDSKSGTITVAGVGDRTMRLPLTFEASRKSTWDDGRAGRPSGGRKFEFYIPSGAWTVRLTGSMPTGDLLVATLYYDGPSQNATVARKGSASHAGPWTYRSRFGLEVIYDDNVLTQHDESIEIWKYGEDLTGFRLARSDDLIVAPKLDVSADRRFWEFGKTRFRTKIKRWMYTYNPIKTNTDFDFYLRQYIGSKKSIELYLHHAPEQYIRQLGDRPPFGEESERQEFRFTRNVANLNWRQTVSRKLSYSILFELNRRYYNRPFMENDIEAWEVRGTVSYRFVKPLKLQFDYSYEDGQARGIDTVGEDRATSDDGDASYLRDLYRFGFDLKTPWAMPVFGSINASYLFMDYYYPTDKPLMDDPFHTGRRDKNTKVTVALNRKVNKKLSVYGTFRYSERVVESPWYGDITLDKDYIQHRYWVGMTYKF